MLYCVFGHIVESDVELLYSTPVTDCSEASDVTIKYENFEDDIARCDSYMASEFQSFQSDNTEFSEKYLRGIGYFRISGGDSIRYTNFMDTGKAEFQQWLLCYCMGMIMLQSGQLALHGSGLLAPDGSYSIDISGESGSGKSTLTEELLRRGFLFQSDDTVAFKMVDGVPCTVGAFPSRRLCKDAVERMNIDSSKLRFLVDGTREKYLFDMSDDYHDKPTPIRCIFILNACDDISAVEIKTAVGGEALQHILHNLYRRDNYTSLGGHPKIFTMALAVASTAKVYLINRPIGIDTSEEICDRVMELLHK